ncbi:MAG: hypothetical protein CM1200mP20_10270 [Pseudomonadota bacterium]|nr:MAG: hypothetical protein CM1200mP20_10270 [Pseudomonadota bacterium]
MPPFFCFWGPRRPALEWPSAPRSPDKSGKPFQQTIEFGQPREANGAVPCVRKRVIKGDWVFRAPSSAGQVVWILPAGSRGRLAREGGRPVSRGWQIQATPGNRPTRCQKLWDLTVKPFTFSGISRAGKAFSRSASAGSSRVRRFHPSSSLAPLTDTPLEQLMKFVAFRLDLPVITAHHQHPPVRV